MQFIDQIAGFAQPKRMWREEVTQRLAACHGGSAWQAYAERPAMYSSAIDTSEGPGCPALSVSRQTVDCVIMPMRRSEDKIELACHDSTASFSRKNGGLSANPSKPKPAGSERWLKLRREST